MAGHFARLKIALVRNGLRSPQFAILFAIGAIGAVTLAVVGFVFLAAVRGDPIAGDATIVVFGAITLLWTIVPLLGFGTDETLDPQRLALLPLTARETRTGLLAAALVGVAPIATAFALAGSLIGMPHDPLAVVLVLAAIVGTLLFCVTASRTLVAVLAPLLRSRRGRDLMIMVVVLAAFVPQSFRLLGADHSAAFRDQLAAIADRVRLTPFGLGGVAASEAGEGHVLAALAALAGLAALTAGLLAVWARVIPRALTSADVAAPARALEPARAGSLPLFPRWLPFLPKTRTGAIAAKELRYYVRDPRRRAPLIAALIVPALFMISLLSDGAERTGAITMLGLVSLLPASGLTLNQFGLDGAALWPQVVTGNDARSDLLGKNLATAVMVVPLVALPAVAVAAVTGGWGYLPITFGLAPGLLGVILAIGNIVSVRVPYALPDRKNPLAANPGQGCIGSMAAISALFVDTALLLPVGVVTGVALVALPLPVATVVAVVASGVYGGAIWLFGLRASSRYLWWRMPELLDAVSPRQAG